MTSLTVSAIAFFEVESLSHRTHDQGYDEEDFLRFREKYSMKMLKPFLQLSLMNLSLLLFMRIFVFQFVNIIHSYCLPACLVFLFWYFNELNKKQANLNTYMLTILIPVVVLIVAQKTISQSPELYHLNESFVSWLIMLIFLGFISPLAWYKVVGISVLSFMLFYIRIVMHFGVANIRNDLYVHFTTVVFIIGIIVR